MTFVMWILGALVSAAGTAVYIEFGTVRYILCFIGLVPHMLWYRVFPGAAAKRSTWSMSSAVLHS